MTKEEIRQKHLLKNGLFANTGPVGKAIQKAAHDAMDEYAKEVTMDFCRWVMGRIDVIYRPTGNDTWEGMRPSIKPMKDEIITDTELFNLYLNHISKTTKE